MHSKTRLAALWFVVSACGGGGDSPGSVNGAIHNASFSVGDVISASVAVTLATGRQHVAVVEMTTTPSACADATNPPIAHPNEKAVFMELFDVNGTTFNTPTVPGTYAIFQGSGTPPAKTANLKVDVIDATCKPVTTSGAKATTGTVTLTAISGNVFTGSFDVALDSGDHITGNFSPEDCPAIQTAVDSTATVPTCM